MPRGDKSAYTNKQKRQAEHIEDGYMDRGVSRDEAERRAWATVNKESGGGKKSGSGRGHAVSHESSSRGGRIGGSTQTAEKRRAAARKGWGCLAACMRRSATRFRGILEDLDEDNPALDGPRVTIEAILVPIGVGLWRGARGIEPRHLIGGKAPTNCS